MQSFRPKGWELNGAISSVGRALDCGSRCRGFEPHIAPQDGRNAVFFVLQRTDLVARSKRHPSDGNEKYRGVLLARGGLKHFVLADGYPVALVDFADSRSSAKSPWQPMCHRTRISIPPCQGGAKKVSLWQAILHRVCSTLPALPK